MKTSKTNKNPRSFWSDLERLGMREIVMVERIRALRAVHNAAGGPLSVKKSKDEPAEELVKLLRTLVKEAA